MIPLRFRRCAAAVIVAGACGDGFAWSGAQQDAGIGIVSVGQQAVSTVLKHYALNPLSIDPKTGKALARDGTWAVGKARPPICPQTEEQCIEVFYQVAAESVRCSWIVLLDSGSDGKFLAENNDAEHYLLRKTSQAEARTLATTRIKPVYPPIAMAAHVSGSVVLEAVIAPSGEMQSVVVASGPEMLRGSALDAARQWKFSPLRVGEKAVPYHVELVFTFRTTGPPTGSVEMTP